MTETSDNGQPLPERLAGRVSANELDALRHPFRRQILRVLQRDAARLSPAELTESGLLPCSISCTAYHLDVLARAGLARQVDSVRTGTAVTRYFSSRLDEDGTVAEILRETDDADEGRLAGEPS